MALVRNTLSLNETCGAFQSLPDEFTKSVFLLAITSAHMPSKQFNILSLVCSPFQKTLDGADMVVAIWKKLFPSNPNLHQEAIHVDTLKEKIFKGLDWERTFLSFSLTALSEPAPQFNTGAVPLYYMHLENIIEALDRQSTYWNIKQLPKITWDSTSILKMLQKFRCVWQKEWEKHDSPLHQIKVLNLSQHGLLRLRPEICSMTALQELYLHWNHLTSLPAEVTLLTNLKKLTLFSNPIENFPLQLTQLTSLSNLTIGLSNGSIEFIWGKNRASDLKILTSHPLSKIKLVLVKNGAKLEII